MRFLMRLRPSNLIILAALPFIVYLFASSGDYQRSLRAIIGIEHGSSVFVPGFLLLALAFAAGLGAVLFSRLAARRPRLAMACGVANLIAAIAVATTGVVRPYAASVVANAVDPFTSKLVVQGVTPRKLTDAAEAMVAGYASALFWTYLAVTVLALTLFFFTGGRAAKAGRVILLAVNGIGLVSILFIAPMAFAAGVATTIRAAVAAYILAAVLGLVWVGLLKLDYSRRAHFTFIAIAALLACAATWFLLQPRDDYALVGALGGKVGVVAGTPSGMIGAVRYGQFPGAPEDEIPLRTFKGPTDAIAALAKKADVSAALLPVAAAPADLPVLWKTSALNDRDKASGITLAVLAIVIGLLTFGGHIHRRHPLSIGSEFIVDTIRGIPMLVIVRPAEPGARHRRDGARLFGLSGRNLPLRHQRHPARPDRGGAQPWPERLADGAPRHPAASLPHHHPAARQRADRHPQGHLAVVDPVDPRHHSAHARVPVGQLPAVRALQFRRHLLHPADARGGQPGQHSREKI